MESVSSAASRGLISDLASHNLNSKERSSVHTCCVLVQYIQGPQEKEEEKYPKGFSLWATESCSNFFSEPPCWVRQDGPCQAHLATRSKAEKRNNKETAVTQESCAQPHRKKEKGKKARHFLQVIMHETCQILRALFLSLLFFFWGGLFKQASTASENATLGFPRAQSTRPFGVISDRTSQRSCLSHERSPLREIRSSIIFFNF